MQMDTDRVGWVTGIIALMSKECAGLDKFFRGASREFRGDKGGAILICHMSVVEPDLLPGMKWIVWDAHDDRRLPIRQAGQVAGVGGDDRRDIDIGSGEDIYALVEMSAS